MKRTPPRLLTIAPGAPFLPVLAEKILAGDLVAGLRYSAGDPLSLARATIFVPTRRAARALRSELTDQIGAGSAILPVIRPLGETDEDAGFLDAPDPSSLTLDPPITHTAAVLRLADLVLGWKQALPQAVRDHLGGAAMVAPANPADAIWLGSNLFDLIQAVESEERDFADLDDAVTADLQHWWQLTREFLAIARDYWPRVLQEISRSSPARHHDAMIDIFTGTLLSGAQDRPVIVAGSTGTRPSTARLIAAVATLQQGAVVLPGLDQLMRKSHWQALAAAAAGSADNPLMANAAIRSHPQYGLMRLIQECGLDIADLGEIPETGRLDPDMETRRAAVSAALLPAEATDAWGEAGFLPEASELLAGFQQVSLIEAANEREEAAALAAAMRQALEPRPDREEPSAALVTPDRNLARRVITELQRYGIAANDSAGAPLMSSPQGGLARLAAHVAFAPGDAVAIAALIKHPLARFGFDRKSAAHGAGLLERIGLRGGSGEADIDQLEALVSERKASRLDRHAAHWLARISDKDADLACDLARRARQALMPLTSVLRPPVGAAALTIGDYADRTAQVLEAVCADRDGDLGALWSDDAGEALANVLIEARDSGAAMTLAGHEWIGALDALLSGRMVKPRAGGHPRAFVWGTLEARLQPVDTLLMGALNEGVWPQTGTEDPFLSRSMKAAIGLEPPERRIGQAAHDFQMAMGTPAVVLSRALRSGKAPTVASRWLQRLLAVTGSETSRAMRARGQAMLDHVRALDLGPSIAPAARPEPRPPAGVQPRRYSFSEVGRLRRDPYAIYARRVLDLDPLEPFLADPGPRERGTLYHAILEAFVSTTPPDARTLEDLARIASQHFREARLPDAIRLVWQTRFAGAARKIVAWEQQTQSQRLRSLVELRAGLELPAAGIKLTGLADRIDLLSDGSAWIIDYKTGGAPSRKEARSLLDPQLALEAFVLRAGGFDGLGATEPSALLYLRLTGKDPFAERIDTDPGKTGRDVAMTPADLADKAVDELTRLVTLLRSGKRGFLSRAIAQSVRAVGGDYDHLARVAEWQTVVESQEGDGDG